MLIQDRAYRNGQNLHSCHLWEFTLLTKFQVAALAQEVLPTTLCEFTFVVPYLHKQLPSVMGSCHSVHLVRMPGLWWHWRHSGRSQSSGSAMLPNQHIGPQSQTMTALSIKPRLASYSFHLQGKMSAAFRQCVLFMWLRAKTIIHTNIFSSTFERDPCIFTHTRWLYTKHAIKE